MLEIIQRRRVLLLSINLAPYWLVNIKHEKNVYAILKGYYQWTFITKILCIMSSGVNSTEHSCCGISYRSFWDTLYTWPSVKPSHRVPQLRNRQKNYHLNGTVVPPNSRLIGSSRKDSRNWKFVKKVTEYYSVNNNSELLQPKPLKTCS